MPRRREIQQILPDGGWNRTPVWLAADAVMIVAWLIVLLS